MPRRNNRRESRNRITSTSTNNVQIDLCLKTIQEDACQILLSEFYDDISRQISKKWPYSICTFIIGAGVSGIIQRLADLEEIGKITIESLWNSNKIFLLLISLGSIFLYIYHLFERHQLIQGKKPLLELYLNSPKWNIVSNPSSLSLNNSDYYIEPEDK